MEIICQEYSSLTDIFRCFQYKHPRFRCPLPELCIIKKKKKKKKRKKKNKERDKERIISFICIPMFTLRD